MARGEKRMRRVERIPNSPAIRGPPEGIFRGPRQLETPTGARCAPFIAGFVPLTIGSTLALRIRFIIESGELLNASQKGDVTSVAAKNVRCSGCTGRSLLQRPPSKSFRVKALLPA
jgi:hypothetical protein